jgi:hypothetical protein
MLQLIGLAACDGINNRSSKLVVIPSFRYKARKQINKRHDLSQNNFNLKGLSKLWGHTGLGGGKNP